MLIDEGTRFVAKYPNNAKPQFLDVDDLTGPVLKAAINYLEEQTFGEKWPEEGKFSPFDRPNDVSILSCLFFIFSWTYKCISEINLNNFFC